VCAGHAPVWIAWKGCPKVPRKRKEQQTMNNKLDELREGKHCPFLAQIFTTIFLRRVNR
jgi:hypothetical protein